MTVKFIGYGNVEKVPADKVRLLKPVPNAVLPSTLAPGMKVQVKYASDGKFYSAALEAKVYGEWKVKYMAYGNTEIVPSEYVRAMPTAKKSEVSGSGSAVVVQPHPPSPLFFACVNARQSGGRAIKEEFELPEHLVVHTTDDEKTRKRKQKQVKQLKREHRLALYVLSLLLTHRSARHAAHACSPMRLLLAAKKKCSMRNRRRGLTFGTKPRRKARKSPALPPKPSPRKAFSRRRTPLTGVWASLGRTRA